MRRSTIAVAVGVFAVALSAAACGSDTGAESGSAPRTTSATAPSTTVARPSGAIDELVAIGHGRLHLRCSGSGETTVLLIAGWDHGAADWAGIEPSIAEHARVCSYDRFGTGTSDAAATPQTFDSQIADLHELLDEAGEPGPYVVVGHSFGGAHAVTFASRYPEEVTGLMLVDASPTTWPDAVCSVPAFAGGCALMRNPAQGERLDVFPAFAAVAKITSLGNLPMTVMTAADRPSVGLTPDQLARLSTIWQEGTQRWATLSTASSIVTVQDTGHAIQDDQPAIVLGEIVKLIAHSDDESASER
jgi:pimeloyl-ACP methyl ester carboxylesterase